MAQEDVRPASRNFRGLQVIRSAQVAHEAKGKAKIAAMQEFYSTCFLKILLPVQARAVGAKKRLSHVSRVAAVLRYPTIPAAI